MKGALLEGRKDVPLPYPGAPWALGFAAKLLREREVGAESEWARCAAIRNPKL